MGSIQILSKINTLPPIRQLAPTFKITEVHLARTATSLKLPSILSLFSWEQESNPIPGLSPPSLITLEVDISSPITTASIEAPPTENNHILRL